MDSKRISFFIKTVYQSCMFVGGVLLLCSGCSQHILSPTNWVPLWKTTQFKQIIAQLFGGCSIHWLHLCRGVKTPPPTSVLVMTLNHQMASLKSVELRGIHSTLSLPLLPGPLLPRVVEPDRVLSMGQTEVWHLNCPNKWLLLNWTVRNRKI